MDLMGLFHRQLIGLDIGISGIKAIELSSQKNPRLIAYNRVPLPFGAISKEGEFKDRDTIVDGLRKLFKTRLFSHKKVAVGLSGNSVITKKITVAEMNREELNNQMYWEAEQYLPFNIAEVNIDFAILGKNEQASSSSPMMDVLIVAAKKDYIQTLSALIEEAGLSIEVIDNQAFAIGNAFEFNYLVNPEMHKKGSYLLIDFGAGSTKMTIVEGNKTTFTRELRQCGLSCTQLLSERLGMSAEQAENAKIKDSNSAQVKQLVGEFIHTLVEEIATTIDFAIAQGGDKVIQGIYLCGGGSRLEGLVPALENKFSYPLYPLNPIKKVSGTGEKMNTDVIQEISYLGAVAVGLALRRAEDTA